MKALGLIAGLTVLALGLVALAEYISTDSGHPNHVPHPAGMMLAVSFAHADHVDQTCISCHHNYVDNTGIGMCFDCHKTDPEVSPLIEEQFHDLCRSCHIDHQLKGEPHGPVRQCIRCHVPDEAP